MHFESATPLPQWPPITVCPPWESRSAVHSATLPLMSKTPNGLRHEGNAPALAGVLASVLQAAGAYSFPYG